MTLRHLEIFRTVCRLESVTRAAEALNMTQPAVSIAVRELEAFYQVRLFDRMNRRLYLTEPGRTLWQYAENLLSQFDASIDALRGQQLRPSCTLGVNGTFGETRLSGLLQRARDRHPELNLRVIVDNSQVIERHLMQNEVDLAILDELSHPQSLKTWVLYREHMVIVGRPDRLPEEITVETLSRQPLLLREPGSGSRKCVEAVFQRHGCPVAPAAECSNTLTLMALAEAGFGLTLLPKSVAEAVMPGRNLCCAEPLDDCFERCFYLAIHPQKYLTDAIRSLLELIRSGE